MWSWRMHWSKCGRSSDIMRYSSWWTHVSLSRCFNSSIHQTSWRSAVVTSARTLYLITLIQRSASTSSTDTHTTHWSFSSRSNQTVSTRWLSFSRSDSHALLLLLQLFLANLVLQPCITFQLTAWTNVELADALEQKALKHSAWWCRWQWQWQWQCHWQCHRRAGALRQPHASPGCG